MPALRGFAFARCCGSSSASIPHALTGKVGSGSRRFRPRAAAYDSWLPPVGPIRDFHPPPFIHASRTQSPHTGSFRFPPRSLSHSTYSTNSWIKLSSDELNRLPLKFAPLVPISLLATTTVANAGTNVQQKVTPLRVHNQSKFRYPLTNLTTSDRWTVRSLRKWAILAVPKEPHPNQFVTGVSELAPPK